MENITITTKKVEELATIIQHCLNQGIDINSDIEFDVDPVKVDSERQRLIDELVKDINLQAPKLLGPLNHEVDYIWDMKVSSNLAHTRGLEVPLHVNVVVEFVVRRAADSVIDSPSNQSTTGIQRFKKFDNHE